MKKIPLVHGEWIDYKGNVLIIKEDEYGVDARFQFDGVSCKQGEVRGMIYKEFQSSSKWFDPEWWYTRTVWSTDPAKVHFHDSEIKKLKLPSFTNPTPKEWEDLYKQATEDAIPVSQILDELKEAIEVSICDKIEFNFTNKQYGEDWYEAFVPIKIRGVEYLLTWENCD